MADTPNNDSSGSYTEEHSGSESASEGRYGNGNKSIYSLYSDDGVKRIYNPDSSQIIFRNMYHSGFQGPPLPILVNNSEYRPRDEALFLKQFHKAQTKPKERIKAKVGNCLCKSSWCPRCHRLFYVPKYKEYINKFNYKKTRHVILTTDRNNFINELDALQIITAKKALSAFIRKLRKGKKIKRGNQWVYIHLPVIITQAIAVLEFHKDGFPHWHLLIEVEGTGKAGMIGGENLHRSWKYGVVRETYFRNLSHWNNIAGYFADKGYFEKGKKYQTELPELIKEHINKRIRRITYYPGKREGIEEEIHPDLSETEAFKDISAYFRKKEPKKEKRITSYKAILGRCGKKTYFKLLSKLQLFSMIVPLRFEITKSLLNPAYEEGKGYICELSRETIALLEINAERVIRSKRDYFQHSDKKEEEQKEPLSDGGEIH